MNKFLNRMIIIVCLSSMLFSQSNHPYPPLDMVSIPTSGTLPRGSYTLETLLTKNGGFVPRLMIGLSDNFSLGMSFGVRNFIGEEKPEKNKATPEVQLKYRIFEETESSPAFLIGLDTQGFGPFIQNAEYSKFVVIGVDEDNNQIVEEQIVHREINRYEQKAWGMYIVASKNWALLGNLGLHIGLCKSISENDDGDEDINVFFGIDKELNRSFSLLIEYDAALNDNEYEIEDITFGKGRGYLNAGIRWAVSPNLLMEIN